MDRLDLVHALCQQIPTPARTWFVTTALRELHEATPRRGPRRVGARRSAGCRGPPRAQELLPRDVSFEDPPTPAPLGSAAALRRQAWARMLRKVFEVDPLRCPRCGTQMEVVAWITQPPVVDATSGTAASTRPSPRSRPARRRRRSRRAGRGRRRHPRVGPRRFLPGPVPGTAACRAGPTPCRDGTRGTTIGSVVARGGRGP